MRQRWKEYTKELYNSKNRPSEEEIQEAIQNSEEETDTVGQQMLYEEIVKALEAIKLGKTEGVDGIPIEMIKGLGENATEEFVQIC